MHVKFLQHDNVLPQNSQLLPVWTRRLTELASHYGYVNRSNHGRYKIADTKGNISVDGNFLTVNQQRKTQHAQAVLMIIRSASS